MKIRIALALLIVSATTASAADFPRRAPVPYAKAPVVPQVDNWSGFYIGAMGGYAMSQNVRFDGDRARTRDIKGPFGGLTVGYNWQAAGSPWVFGVEADAAFSEIAFRTNDADFRGEFKTRGLGSVTGRIGFAADAVLLYAKGGAAFSRQRIAFNNISEDRFHTGWTAGGGLEFKLTPNWSTKAEYMYASFNKQNYFGGLAFGADFHTAKVGINYGFGWGRQTASRY